MGGGRRPAACPLGPAGRRATAGPRSSTPARTRSAQQPVDPRGERVGGRDPQANAAHRLSRSRSIRRRQASCSAPPSGVLVVEDDGLVRSLLVVAREDAGWRVLESDHAPDPTDVSQLRPQVVVLDLRLGVGGDGASLLEGIRATPGARAIPVVVCAADLVRARAQGDRLRELGADELLMPVDLDELLRAVAAAPGVPIEAPSS